MTTKWQKYLKETPFVAGILNLPVGDLGLGNNADPNAILPAVANRIADILTALAYPIAFIGIIYTVYTLVANSGNPDALKTAKKNIGYIAGGIFLFILSVAIFNLVVRIFYHG